MTLNRIIMQTFLVISLAMPGTTRALIILQDDFNDATLVNQPDGLNWKPIIPAQQGSTQPTIAAPLQAYTFQTYQQDQQNWMMHIVRQAAEEISLIEMGAHVFDQPLPAVAGTEYSVSTDIYYIDPPTLGNPDQFQGVIGYGQNWTPTSGDFNETGDFYLGMVDPLRGALVIGKQLNDFSPVPFGLAATQLPQDIWLRASDGKLNLQMDIFEHSDGLVDIDLVLQWTEENPAEAGAYLPFSAQVSYTDQDMVMFNPDTNEQWFLPSLLGGGTTGVWGLGMSEPSPQAVNLNSNSVNGLFDNFGASSSVPEPSTTGLAICAGIAVLQRFRRKKRG
jgi:hypothetical protein